MPRPPENLSGHHEYHIEYFPSGDPLPDEVLSFYHKANETLKNQGEEYSHLWEGHIQRSQEQILEAADGLHGKAVIFGLGNGMDIPLGTLVEYFDRTTIVDMDAESAGKAIEKLPLHMQRKCTLIVDDITGNLGMYSSLVSRGDQKLSPPDVLNRATAFTDKVKVRPYDLPDTYDFAVSSLVATFLTTGFIDYTLQDVIKPGEYIGVFNSAQMNRYRRTLPQLSEKITRTYIAALANAVTPQGRVYIADTMSEHNARRDPLTHDLYLDQQRVFKVDPAQYANSINSQFAVLENERWVWYRVPPHSTFDGRVNGIGYHVQSATLQRKET